MQDNNPQTQERTAPSALTGTSQVISHGLASQYWLELARQVPAYYWSGKPMSQEDIKLRMLKLALYDAQKT